MDKRRLEADRIRAAEDEVVRGIPADLLARLEIANAKYAATGGCRGCASKRIGVHFYGCTALRDESDLY